MEVSSDLVKQLREMTGAGIMDCKKALAEANNDIEKAKEILKIKGLAKADKKAGRETKEGIAYGVSTPEKGVLIELACETDFVARNEEFKNLASEIANSLLELSVIGFDVKNGQELSSLKLKDGKTLEERIKEAIAKIGENIQLKRVCLASGKNYIYIHGMRVGVLVSYEGDESVVKDVALQIAAMKPEFVSVDKIPSEYIEKEKAIFKEQAKAEGKPENILDKIAEGKLKKLYEEKVLLEQPFIKDEKKKIKDILGNTVIRDFCRIEIGK